LGDPVTPEQILQDWLSYRLLFDDLLKRFGALLARQAKAEHQKIREQLDLPTHREAVVQSDRKSALRSKIAAMRGLTVHHRSNAVPISEAFPTPPPAPELPPEYEDDEP
jgi:hypothetical protein